MDQYPDRNFWLWRLSLYVFHSQYEWKKTHFLSAEKEIAAISFTYATGNSIRANMLQIGCEMLADCCNNYLDEFLRKVIISTGGPQ